MLFFASARTLHSVIAASTVAYGPTGVCLPPSVTTVEVIQPYVYSTVIAEGVSTQINIFGNSDTVNYYGPSTIISTTTSTITTTVGASPTGTTGAAFNILVQSTNSKGKRAASYLGFSGNNGIVVGSQAEAALFDIVNGYLMFGLEFITTASNSGAQDFIKQASQPVSQGAWAVNSNTVEFSNPAFTLGNGEALFCVDANEDLLVEFTSKPSFICTEVTLIAQTGKHS